MKNDTSIYYSDEVEQNKDSIIYQFKPKLRVVKNYTFLKHDQDFINEKNSSLNDENQNDTLDNTINKHLSNCMLKYKEIFINTMMNEFLEDGYISNSQKLYDIIQNEYGNITSTMFLGNVYKENALNNKIIKSILYILSKIKPNKLNGIEEGIIAFALMNKDYEIRDLALQCFEKWNDKRYLNLLRSLDMNVDFLQEYLNYIINELENVSDK